MFGTHKDTNEDCNSSKIIEDLDHKNNNFKDNSSTKNNSSSSFLNWINRFNNTNSNSKILSSSGRILDNQEDTIIDEYKGVQGLKEFWNNKLTLLKTNKQTKSATLDGTHRKFSSFDSNLSSSKSISCLINDHSLSFDSNLDQKNFNDNHLQSDNFYKYKNSSTKKRLSLCDGINISNNLESKIKVQKVYGIGTNFPLIASTPTGEKIHWAKREDILFVHSKTKKQQNSTVDLEKKSSYTTNRIVVIF